MSFLRIFKSGLAQRFISLSKTRVIRVCSSNLYGQINVSFRHASRMTSERSAFSGVTNTSGFGLEPTMNTRECYRRFSIAVLLIAFTVTNAHAEPVTYEDVRPVFEKRCAGCHWPGADKLQRSELDLSTRAALLAGGKTGDAIIPGNAQESALVQMIEYRLDPEMPPKKDADPLPAEEIALIRQWIDGGALGADADAQEPVPPGVAAADSGDVAPPTLLDAAVVDATPVTALAWSPDGKYLAEGRLQTVIIKDGETGAELTRLTGHAEQVRALAFSPDGALLAAGGGKPGETGEVLIWRAADWTRAATLGEHRDSVLAVAFSPDGKHLATASYDKTACVWSTHDWSIVHSFAEHVDAIYALAWSPESATLVTGAGDRTVKLWDVTEGKRLLTLSDATSAVHALAYAPDGRHIAAGAADKMIYVWDVAKSGAEFSQSGLTSGVLEHATFAHENPVLALAYGPKGERLYSAAQDGRIKAWDAATMSEATVFEEQPDWALALAVHPGGGRIAVGRYDAAAPIYDTATGARVDTAASLQVASQDEQDVEKSGEDRAAELDVDAVIINATIPPSLQSVSPNKADRGGEIEMRLNGKNLADAAVFCSNPAIHVAILENEAKDIPEFRYDRNSTGAQIFDYARPHAMKVRVTIPADAHPGRYELFVRTPHGLTNGQAFDVAPWPVMQEVESADGAPQTVAIPATVAGAVEDDGQSDQYAVALEAGDELVAVLADSDVAAALHVLDPAGETVADGVHVEGMRLAFRAPAAGTYVVEVAPSEPKTGSYRLHLGAFPWVTRVDARGVIAGQENSVPVEGYNLGTNVFVLTPAADLRPGDMVPLPVPGFAGNPIDAPRIAVGHDPELAEAEPNNSVENAQLIEWPATLNASLEANEDDLYRFAAKAGQTVVLEVAAARLGARADLVLEILDAMGEPLLRAKARCVAQTMLTLADRDSFTAGLRIEDWSAFTINDYVMVGSEVLRVLALPDYADEDLVVHDSSTGQRMGFFGTTPEHHAVGAPVYKVEIHPPGATFAPNGMPVFPIYWRNDDHIYHDATRGDSRIDFVAPEDGEFLVRVSDAIPREGGEALYRLHLRPLRPDFDVFVGPGRVNVSAGERVPMDATVRRYDGFDASVQITPQDLPAGYDVAGVTVPAQSDFMRFALAAAPDAATLPWEQNLRFLATAVQNGKPITRETSLDHVEVVHAQADLSVIADAEEIVLRPGETYRLNVRLARHNGFTSRVPLDAINLPFGVRVLDTGLNGVLVREGETERSMEIYVEPWVEPVSATVFAQARIESPSPGRMLFLSAPISFRVESAATQVAEDGAPTEAD